VKPARCRIVSGGTLPSVFGGRFLLPREVCVMKTLQQVDLTKPGWAEVIVTPACAAWALQYNTCNRRLRPSHVKYLSRMMRSEEWNGQHPSPLAFSTQGVLLDGQHRLSAVVQYGEPVVMTVVTGRPPETFAYIDSGVNRTMHDRVTVDDSMTTNMRAVMVAQTWCALEITIAENKSALHSQKMTPKQISDCIDRHRDAIIWVASHPMRNQRGIKRIGVSVALAMFYEIDPIQAERFAKALCVPQTEIQQTIALREAMIAMSDRNGGGQIGESIRRTVYAIEAFRQDREVKQLRLGNWTLEKGGK
jgi:hypothetical protein